eukprot:Awhi_evm1s11416
MDETLSRRPMTPGEEITPEMAQKIAKERNMETFENILSYRVEKLEGPLIRSNSDDSKLLKLSIDSSSSDEGDDNEYDGNANDIIVDEETENEKFKRSCENVNGSKKLLPQMNRLKVNGGLSEMKKSVSWGNLSVLAYEISEEEKKTKKKKKAPAIAVSYAPIGS